MRRLPPLILSVLLAAACSTSKAAAPTASECGTAPLPAGSRVSVVGDSLSAGLPETGGVGDRGWPALLEKSTGWQVSNHSLVGAGFIAPGLGADGKTYDGPTFVDLAQQVGPSDLVLVFGSTNDLNYLGESGAPERYEAAFAEVLATVRAQAPRVVVATSSVFGAPDKAESDMRDLEKRLTTGACTDFLDPMAEGWFEDGQLVADDGKHPSDAGHERLAERWRGDLGQLGLVP